MEGVLDLACGTGQIAFALARHAVEVIAGDQEGESVTFGQAKAEACGVSNIPWLTDTAETVILNGPFELVAVGNAFSATEPTDRGPAEVLTAAGGWRRRALVGRQPMGR